MKLVKTKEDEAYISINEVKRDVEIFGDCSVSPLQPGPNVLVLHFDDAEEDLPLLNGEKLTLFNEYMAKQVFDFIQANIQAKRWVIHCTSGQSRSGAIGSVLTDYFGITWEDFKRDNPIVKPNALVKKLLTQEFQKSEL